MRKVLHKVKSQWIVLGVLGATVVSLGTADVRQVSASEIEGASASETLAARELGTADVSVEAAEKAAHIGLDHAISTATTDGTATVFVHWNEDETITVTVKDLNGSVLYSDLLVDSEGENTIKVLTANQDYYTIKIAVKAAATEQTTTATEPIELAVPEVLAEVEAPEEVAAEENDYAKIVSTTEVDYPAVIARATDAINTAPWGVEGYQTLASSADYAGKTVDVTKEQVTDYGVTWALVSLNGKELGWIVKDALTVQTYAAITSETIVDYPATISRGTDAINLAPWGTRGYQTISSSATYVGKTVNVIKEQTTDYGVTWAQISLNGEVLGWIAKDALTAQTYAAVVSETEVDYPATVNRDSDAINTAPWGVKGYQTLSSSADYVGQTVEVKKEQVTDYGVTWAQISLNGEVLGWIAKDALKIQTYAQITKETETDYSATISRDSDAINTAPWGVKGYQTLSSSTAFVGQTVEVTKEQVTDYGVTWAQISLNGEVLGWIAKDALKVQTYAQITKETVVSYDAIVNRDSDAINTAPWGVKGYQTLSSSAAYVGQTVEVTKEQTTDYGVIWALVSQNGKELGWIAKDALKVQTYAQIIKETAVSYDAIVNRASDAINTAPWGVKGYQTLSSSAAYAGQTVEVTKEQVTDYGVTWAEISLNGEVLGWIAKDALKVQTYAQIVSEKEVAYPALISRGTDAINTAPWGTKGYQTNASSADYLGQTVEVTKEQTTDYGVTWSLVSLNGKELGWIAKDALTVLERTVETVVAKENKVAHQIVTEEDNTIPTGESQVVQAGADGYDTVTYDVTYVNGIETNRVEVSRSTTAPVTQIVKVGTQVTEVKSETTTENEVAFATVEEEDNTIPAGERVVVQAGVKGYDTVTFDVTYVNGIETNRVEVSRTTTAPVAEVVKVGTQVTEVKPETTTENEVGFGTVEEEDNTIPTGERIVVQAGTNGYDTVTYDVTYVNGVETNRVEVSRATTAPVAEVIKIGTQVTEVKSESAHENAVQYGTQEQSDANLFIGERQVIQQGSEGYDVVIYDVTYVNGVEVSRIEVSRETIAPVEEIVKVGTKQAIASIGGFRIEELSVDASGVYEGYNNKNVVLRMTATSKNANITYAYVNYESANGYSDQLQFVNVGNNVFEATIPFSSYYTHAGLYKIGLIGASDSAGNTWVIFPEGNGSGLNYTSADLSAADFTIKETSGLASVAGVTLESITIENPSVYVGEWSTNKVTMKVKSDGAPISSASITFTLPNGWDNRCDFVYVENDTYEATVECFPKFYFAGAGSYGVESINIYDVNGNVFIFFPEGYGTGLNYDSGDLSGAYFEAINRPVVTTETIAEANPIPFETIYQDDPNLMVGETKVIQSGVFGNETQYYTVTYTDGVKTDRVWSHSELVSAPVAEIVAVGTKQPLAEIGGFTLKDLSVEADVAYAGDWEDSKIITMKVSGTSATIQSAHFNYRLPSGGYGQEDFVYVGNDTYEVAVPTYFWGAGSYQTDSIVLTDSNGNSWIIMSEGNGAGMNYTSADLSASDFEVLPAIASVGGVTLISMDLEDNVIHEDDGTTNKLTIKVKDNDSVITNAYIVYTLPNGYNKRFDFVSVGNDVYEAIINQPYGSFIVGAGNYLVETIFIGDANGDYSLFYPEGYGSGLNYTSGNLSEGNFEVLARPKNIIETTTESVPFDTVYQDDSSMLIGETRVIQSGVAGTKTNYYNVTYYNGVETAREWTHSEVTTAQINEVVAVGTKQPEISNVEQTAPNGMTVKITNVTFTEGATSNILKVSYTETNNTQMRVDQNSFVLYLSDGSNLDQYGGFNSLMPGQSIDRSYSFQLLKSETPKTLEYGDVFFNTSPQPGNPIWDVSYLSN